jgi:hypothetical protein
VKSIKTRPQLWLFSIAGALYLLGVWFHIPYAGGHIYSDIVTVFGGRLDSPSFVVSHLPLINNFVEYPPITAFFMYAMGVLGTFFPLSLPSNFMGDYYKFTSVFLLFPTFLLISELSKLCDILGIRTKNRRTLLYYIATPSFVFMLLLNWYIIGVYFAMFGLRKFLQGSRWVSGILLGISAMSNAVTLLPAFGMFFFDGLGWKARLRFIIGVVIPVVAIYLSLIAINSFPHTYIDANGNLSKFPFILGNSNIITNFLSYEQNWYIEGSWMLAFFNNLNPIRHVIFPVLFVSLSLLTLDTFYKVKRGKTWILPIKVELRNPVRTQKERANLIVRASWYFTFAFLFSTYVFTPQMNMILLPFFVIAPIVKRYWEFLAFDIVNCLVIVYGFSPSLEAFGASFPAPVAFGPVWISPVQALAVIRSFWVGKFLLYDGFIKRRRFGKDDLVPEPEIPAVLATA